MSSGDGKKDEDREDFKVALLKYLTVTTTLKFLLLVSNETKQANARNSSNAVYFIITTPLNLGQQIQFA